MSVFLFPGQGSQQAGMGRSLFERYPDFIRQADDVLGYSVQELCLNDSGQQLRETQYTQPALYTVNALMYFEKKQRPGFVAGHSLGEYNALLAAGAFDFITGLKLVKKRGELMQQQTGGGMAAVIGLTEVAIQGIFEKEAINSVDIANYNASNQLVISGPKNDIEQASDILAKQGAMMVVPLKVSGAFHSRYMRPAQQEFSEFLSGFSFNAPTIPVIANVDARPYAFADIASHLAAQLTRPVRWSDSVLYLAARGENTFEEVGPGRVLTGLLRHILK